MTDSYTYNDTGVPQNNKDRASGKISVFATSMCPVAFKTKYGIGASADNVNFKSHFKKERTRSMSTSPIPRKWARLEWEKDGFHGKERGKLCKLGRESSKDLDETVVQIKSEPIDDTYEYGCKGDVSSGNSTYPSFGSRVRSNSFHSVIKQTDSSKFHPLKTPSSYNSSHHQARQGKGKRPSNAGESLSTSPSSSELANNSQHEEPDSSTGTCEQLMREGGRRLSVSSLGSVDDQGSSQQHNSPGTPTTCTPGSEAVICQVCGDIAAGFYCGAYICEACKKFFIRASKLEKPRYVCLRQKNCVITKESRVHCQYCRYQKCLQLNMFYPKDGQRSVNKVGVQEIPCRVCSAPSSGFHFGALTCEGCKGFFRRMVKEREAYSYKCSKAGTCEVNAMTRNMCKSCRYHKCLQIGMSVEGSRIGRQPNAVKHAISLEAKRQLTLKIEPGSELGEQTDTNVSKISFDSVVLDPCLPGEVEDSLQSVDMGQDSLDLFNLPDCKSDQMKVHERPLNHGHDKHMPDIPSPSTPSQSPAPAPVPAPQQQQQQQPTDLFKMPHQMHALPSNEYRHLQDAYPTDFNPSASSFHLSRNSGFSMFGRSHTDLHISESQTEPQDLSIDTSLIRTRSGSFTGPPTHQSVSSLSPVHHSSPSPHPPVSPCHSTTMSRNTPRNFFRSNSFDGGDLHHPQWQADYQYKESHLGSNSLAFVSDSSSFHYSHPRDMLNNRHIPLQGSHDGVHDAPSQHPSVLHGQHSSPFSPYNRPVDTICEQYPVTSYYLPSPGLQHQAHSLFTRPPSGEAMYTPSRGHQDNISDPNGTGYHGNSPKPNFPKPVPHGQESPHRDRPALQPQDPGQEWSPPQPQTASSQNSPESAPLTPSGSQFVPSSPQPDKDMRPSPVSTPTIDQEKTQSLFPSPAPSPLPSPSPTSDKVGASHDKNGVPFSTKELNSVLLEAAKNLAHLCMTDRGKSDKMDEVAFATVDSTWERMMEHFNFHAKCIVRFAKRMPGFRSLKLDDQVQLLRMATYCLVILNHSRCYEPDTGFYNYFNFSSQEKARIKELFPEFDVLHQHFKHTGIMAKRLSLDELEYAHLSCMLLLNEEYQGIEEISKVKELKERYMDAFQSYEIETFPNGSLRFGEMLLRLSEFSQISMQHNIAVGLVITKNSQLHIPQLYAEMYPQGGAAADGSSS